MNERIAYQLDPHIRLRFESRIGEGVCYIFHNRLQYIRQGGELEYRILRALRGSPRNISVLSAETSVSMDDLGLFLSELEQEQIVRRLDDQTSDEGTETITGDQN